MGLTGVRTTRSSFLRPFVPPPTWRLPPLSVSHRCLEIVIIIIRPSYIDLWRWQGVCRHCVNAVLRSSPMQRNFLSILLLQTPPYPYPYPSCPLLPHDSCTSTYFSKTTIEPKQVDFIRRNYTKAFYCHVDFEQWRVRGRAHIT